jgi:sulfate adenylyltransferase
MSLPSPHGGTLCLQNAPLPPHLSQFSTLEVDAQALADLEMFSCGALSPLRGFLVEQDYASVLDTMQLHSGLVWPLPITLACAEPPSAKELVLTDSHHRPWALLQVESVFKARADEALKVFGTEDLNHVGVAQLRSRPPWRLGGTVRVFPLPDLPFQQLRLTPAQVRQEIVSKKLNTVAAFQTRNPLHRAHEHLTKLALEQCDGLLIHPLVGETKSDDVPAEVRFQIYETMVQNYYPKNNTLLAAFPAAMRYAGPREAVFHALVRKNYGATHFIVGRDHAGYKNFYAPTAAQELASSFSFDELGIHILRFEATFFCRACQSLASAKSCPHEPKHRLDLSGTQVRELLQAGHPLPSQFTRSEVSAILQRHYGVVTQQPRGHIVWLTGLSGAGKSTLAQGLQQCIKDCEVLDGDEVRAFLSKGLGFSKEDRDTNVARMGYVARLLARHSTPVVVAAISPYAEARNEVRALAEAEQIDFIEIHVQAGLETLIARDSKGLYQKALAGQLLHFTGINDPYEAPTTPALRIDTAKASIEENLFAVRSLLRARGLPC